MAVDISVIIPAYNEKRYLPRLLSDVARARQRYRRGTDAIEVVAFVAGVDPQALEVSIDKGLLILSGERPAALVDAGERKIVYADERFVGKFRRVVNLPDDADPARVEAKYADGCLRVTVMKRESSKPRLIQVQ